MTLPIVVVDASVALKWFHEEGEEDVEQSRAVLDAYGSRRIDILLLDLMVYEIGNVLTRAMGVPAASVATVLDALHRIAGPVALTPRERARAAELAAEHRLTFYDAAYAALAVVRGGTLVTVDRALLGAKLGIRPGDLSPP